MCGIIQILRRGIRNFPLFSLFSLATITLTIWDYHLTIAINI